MRVLEGRQQHAPVEVHDARAPADERLRRGVRADEHDPAVADRDRAHPAPRSIQRVHRTVDEDEVGGGNRLVRRGTSD
jgi:hypothetical protein